MKPVKPSGTSEWATFLLISAGGLLAIAAGWLPLGIALFLWVVLLMLLMFHMKAQSRDDSDSDTKE